MREQSPPALDGMAGFLAFIAISSVANERHEAFACGDMANQ